MYVEAGGKISALEATIVSCVPTRVVYIYKYLLTVDTAAGLAAMIATYVVRAAEALDWRSTSPSGFQSETALVCSLLRAELRTSLRM